MIDDLTQLKQFRQHEPPAGDEAREAARAALALAVTAERHRLQRAPTSRRGRRHAPRTGRGRSRSQIWLKRTALVGAVCAVTVAAAATLLAGSPGSPPSAVAAVLEKLATVAKSQPPVDAPRRGQYLYVASLQSNESQAPEVGCTMLVPERREIWIGADGSGRLRETHGPPSYFSQSDRAACQRAGLGSASGRARSDDWFAPNCLAPSLGSRLRGDFNNPAKLLQMMRRIDGGPPGPAENFVHVGDFLRESDASPALRAALYRAAATIPGVRLLGPTHDRSGRSGIGVEFVSSRWRSELIFDSRTSALLGEQTLSPTGAVLEWATYLRTRIVDSPGGRPPAGLGPPCTNTGSGSGHDLPGGGSVINGAPPAP